MIFALIVKLENVLLYILVLGLTKKHIVFTFRLVLMHVLLGKSPIILDYSKNALAYRENLKLHWCCTYFVVRLILKTNKGKHKSTRTNLNFAQLIDRSTVKGAKLINLPHESPLKVVW